MISIGRRLNEMIQEGKDVELNCHFCNTNYVFHVENERRSFGGVRSEGMDL